MHEGIPPDKKRVFDIGTVIEIHLRLQPLWPDTEIYHYDRPLLFRLGAPDGHPFHDRQADMLAPVFFRQSEFDNISFYCEIPGIEGRDGRSGVYSGGE